MKKGICILLMVLLTVSVCACTGAKEPNAEQTGSAEISLVSENSAPGVSASVSEDKTESTEAAVSDESVESSETEAVSNAASDMTSDTVSDLLAGHIMKLPDDLFESGVPIGVNGDWIYYADKDGKLLGRVHLDGSDRLRYENKEIYYPSVEGDRIYYVGDEEENCLYAMEFDGTEVTLLREESTDCHLSDVAFIDGRIHYSEVLYKYDSKSDRYYPDWDGIKFYSVKPDGTNKQERVYGVSEMNGWVYKYVSENGNRRICKMRLNGSEKTIVTDFEVDDFTILDGWFYYTLLGSTEETGIYKMKIDGTDRQKICNDYTILYKVCFDETNLYYLNVPYSDKIDLSGKLYTVKKDGTNRRELSDKAVAGLFMEKDTIFFQADDARNLYAINKDGANERCIAKDADLLLKTDSGFLYESDDTIYFYSYEKIAS